MSFNIAIDGPAGAGKSTIAKQLAKELGFIYVDTGAMYRAMAVYFLRSQTDVNKPAQVEQACSAVEITLEYVDGIQQVILNGENVTALLRREETGKMASVISALPPVRVKLVELQQALAAVHDVVMDGRDIGTVVLPDAAVKIYLTASAQTRAERRYLELTEKGIPCKIEEIETDIINRDYRDMHREMSPLKQAEDAVLVDSSGMTVEEVVEQIRRIIAEKNIEV